MKPKTFWTILLLCLIAPLGLCKAGSIGTAFTYQGRLIDNNQPANGLYDLQFRLFDSTSNGNQIGGDVNAPETPVNDGYFTVELDFGNVFDGNDRWLEIGVRPGAERPECVCNAKSAAETYGHTLCPLCKDGWQWWRGHSSRAR